MKIIHYYSKLFTGVLKRDLRRAIPRAARAAGDAIVATASQPMASAGALFESCWLGAANQESAAATPQKENINSTNVQSIQYKETLRQNINRKQIIIDIRRIGQKIG